MTWPLAHLLVPADTRTAAPADPTADAGTRLRVPLVAGLPQRIPFDGDLHAVLVLPTGLARSWLDAAPDAVVDSSAAESTPHDPAAPAAPLGGRSPLRLVVRRGGTVLGTVPLVAGLARRCRDDAGPAEVEVTVHGWRLVAGTVRGPGDHGSYVEVTWRRADRAVDVFGPPPTSPFVLRRKPPAERSESVPGRYDLLVPYLRGDLLRVDLQRVVVRRRVRGVIR